MLTPMSATDEVTRRGFLSGLGAVAALGAVGAGQLGTASAAQAATPDPVLHLVRRATYGPTPELLATVRRMGREQWLDKQLHPGQIDDSASGLVKRWPRLNWSSATVHGALKIGSWDVMFDLVQAHIARAAWSERQLFEVMVDFWSNHLNVTCPSSDVWSTRHLFDSQVIRKHALGRFSDMLAASARHPAMLLYLDNANSTSKAPNENYARELLELHTVGLIYSEADVKAAARLLTGLSVDRATSSYAYNPVLHATGPVKILGWSHANGSANGEDAALAYVRYLAHHPATARRIARKLAVHFVSDDPSASLVTRLAKIYLAKDTDIRPVLRALFLSPEFARSAGQKVRRPFEDLVATVRALGLRPPKGGTEGMLQLYWVSSELGQPPLGWTPPNGYPDVAAAWTSAGGTLAKWNSHLGLAAGWWPNDLRHPELSARLRPRNPKTHGQLVDAAAAGLGLPRPTPAVRTAICRFLEKQPSDKLHKTDEAMTWRLPYVFGLLLDSPAFATR
jgi:uncharacterized protein (DUF1800 family)